jgi:hypothetical protein
MAAAAAAGQQFALITSQGIPFIQPGIPAIYSSPAGKYTHTHTRTHTLEEGRWRHGTYKA